MTRFDFGYALAEYSLAMIAIGMIVGQLLNYTTEGWPAGGKWWASHVIVITTIVLILLCIARFVSLIRMFKIQ